MIGDRGQVIAMEGEDIKLIQEERSSELLVKAARSAVNTECLSLSHLR